MRWLEQQEPGGDPNDTVRATGVLGDDGIHGGEISNIADMVLTAVGTASCASAVRRPTQTGVSHVRSNSRPLPDRCPLLLYDDRRHLMPSRPKSLTFRSFIQNSHANLVHEGSMGGQRRWIHLF